MRLQRPGQTPLTGEYAFQRADLSGFDGLAGSLSSDDKFQGVLGRIEAHGSIDIPDFSVTRSHHSVSLEK